MLEKKLVKLLADIFMLYMKSYKYHWNIKGENFISIHKLYHDLYSYLDEVIDEIAERSIGLGYYTPCSALEFCAISSIKESEGFSMSIPETLSDLSSDLDFISMSIRDSYKVCDEATLSLLNEYELQIDKFRWLIRSNIS